MVIEASDPGHVDQPTEQPKSSDPDCHLPVQRAVAPTASLGVRRSPGPTLNAFGGMAAAEGTPTNDRLLYRITEVASQLNVSRSKVYELLASGALPSVTIHRTRLVRADDLRAFVDGLEPSCPRATRAQFPTT